MLLVYIQLNDQIKSNHERSFHCLTFTYSVQDQDQAMDEWPQNGHTNLKCADLHTPVDDSYFFSCNVQQHLSICWSPNVQNLCFYRWL